MKKIICVAGPTGSGKTSFAVALAKEYNGEIISADSMQIYKDMNIGTAKPDIDEMEGIPHHIMSIISPFEEFSVKDFVDLAKIKIDEILSKGKIPIVVGGTGLYINSLIDNVDFKESKGDEDLRKELLEISKEKGTEFLHNMLKEIDYDSYLRIHKNNVKRVIRAIEIYKTTGITMTEQIKMSKKIPSPYNTVYVGLNTDREIIYSRINKRVDNMIEKGLIEEVKKLYKSGLSLKYKSAQAIGYKEIIMYLEGNITKDEAIELIKKESRNYAKRQLTWFRKDERLKWIDISKYNTIKLQLDYFKNIYKEI